MFRRVIAVLLVLSALLVAAAPTLAAEPSGQVNLSGKADPDGYFVRVKNTSSRPVVIYWVVKKMRGNSHPSNSEIHYNPDGTTVAPRGVLRVREPWSMTADPAQNTGYSWYVEVREVGVSGMIGDFITAKYDIEVVGPQPFNIKYTNFRATRQDGKIIIAWRTSEEIGARGYMIHGGSTADPAEMGLISSETIPATGPGLYRRVISVPSEMQYIAITGFGIGDWVENSPVFPIRVR